MIALPPLILASASPRRRELLAHLNIPFNVSVSQVDESLIEAPNPRAFAREAAAEKCRDVAGRSGADAVVIGADTVVCFQGLPAPPDAPVMLGKPRDAEDAARMLNWLSGRQHRVITAVALLGPGKGLCLEDYSSLVRFHPLDEETIQAYIATGEPLDKAGAYGIQDVGVRYVQEVEGDLLNVIGLPLHGLARQLRPYYPGLPSLEPIPFVAVKGRT